MGKRKSFGWWFLLAVILGNGIVFLFSHSAFTTSINLFVKILLRVIPVLAIVFVLMTLTNYFITPKFIKKHLKGSKLKGWLIFIAGGILSTGPIYMWYPLLAELNKKGLSFGLISCFLYNRAIKIPWLPLAVAYFGGAYVAVLTAVMIVASIAQGLLINKLMTK